MFFVFIPIIDIRGTSVFECPGGFLDFMPKQEDLNIMNMSGERKPKYESFSLKVPVPYGILCRETNHELYDEMPTHALAEYKAICDSRHEYRIKEPTSKFCS